MQQDPRLGAISESWAAERLEERGWLLLARNLRTPYGEIDLLARAPGPAGPALVAVEVKARHDFAWLSGEDLLQPRQRARLGRALGWCARRMAWSGPRRVDLAAVQLQEGRPEAWQLIADVDCGATT